MTAAASGPLPAIIVFADGASRGNPGPGGWGAIVAFPEGEVVELGGGEPRTTNNRMELRAVMAALRLIAERDDAVVVHTDSTYVIHGITQWIHGWRRKGWKTQQGTDVLNRDLWEELGELAGRRVRWDHVRGHSGIAGNERADAIAASFAAGRPVPLYRGARAAYEVDLDDGVGARKGERPSVKRSGGKSAAKAYSYLSLVAGALRRHRTWAECEARVRGVSGARFKKATSAADEAAIVRAWGLDPESLPRA